MAGEFELNMLINGKDLYEITNDNKFHTKKPVLKVKQTNLRELNEEDLSKIKDHDLLESLIRLFNEEELESLLTQIQELREMLIEQIRKKFGYRKISQRK